MTLHKTCTVVLVIGLAFAISSRAEANESVRDDALHAAARAGEQAPGSVDHPLSGAIVVAAAESTDGSASGDPARTVRAAAIAGVSLGMSMEEAVDALEGAGFEVRKSNERCLGHDNDQDNPCHRPMTGVTLKRISGPSRFEGGFSEVTLRLSNDQVYWIRKADGFLVDRLPDDFDMEALVEKYRADYTARFADAKYQARGTSGRSHMHDFDDEVPPPWQGWITSPHAQVSVPDSSGRGRYVTAIEMHWKDLVGLEW